MFISKYLVIFQISLLLVVDIRLVSLNKWIHECTWFQFFKYFETQFIGQHMVYLGEYSRFTWKTSVFCNYWVKFFFALLLRYSWHTALCKFVYSVMSWLTYVISTVNLVNIVISFTYQKKRRKVLRSTLLNFKYTIQQCNLLSSCCTLWIHFYF